MKILLGLSGSVATTLQKKLIEELSQDHEVQVVMTTSSKFFVKESVEGVLYHTDKSEWTAYIKDKTVLHIDLTKWADKFIIAPCSANTLAKISTGICDNLLTCCARAWDFEKPFVIAPAMNKYMWSHPVTLEHYLKVQSWGIKIVNPIEKVLFCGDEGVGAMAEIKDIIK